MDITVHNTPLCGAVTVPSSKSFVQRQLIAAALSEQESQLRFRGFSADIAAAADCIRALGGSCTCLPPDETGMETLCIAPVLGRGPAAPQLDCGESGAVARFFLPVAAAWQTVRCGTAGFSLTGGERLQQRPMAELCAALRAHGCTVSADSLPLRVGGALAGGAYALPGNVSSQYITGLLLALPLLQEDSVLRLTTPASSAGYLDITAAVLAQSGVAVQPFEENGLRGWRIPGGQRYAFAAVGKGEGPKKCGGDFAAEAAGSAKTAGAVQAEGDWSNGAFWLCADALLRARGHAGLAVHGLAADSVQGDRAVQRYIAAITAPGDTAVDADACPDLVPVLAVLAAAQHKTTVFVNAARLRQKESDRIAAACALLHALGGAAQQTADTLTVHGTGGLRGGTVDGMGDHRIVMAAAVAALVCKAPVRICGAQAVQKSYPAFFADWKALGGVCG